MLTSDLQLESACFFGASDSQLKGTLRPGSHVSIDWRKGNAAYISFQTVIAHDELERISRIVPSDEKMPP